MITTPEWYTPEATIWKPNDAAATDAAYKAALRQQVANGATHLIREVLARYPGVDVPLSYNDPDRYTEEALRELAAMASSEFDLLKWSHQVWVPKVDWHVTEHEDRARLVARVAVIEGTPFHRLYGQPEYEQYKGRLGAYRRSKAPGHRLFEMGAAQLMVGHPRNDPEFDNLYMIDPEPIF